MHKLILIIIIIVIGCNGLCDMCTNARDIPVVTVHTNYTSSNCAHKLTHNQQNRNTAHTCITVFLIMSRSL